jgi:2-oxoglutarate dehydrogenase complex dehydrogenase (E1) component-like enzyme
VRVEQLYPWPEQQLRAIVDRYEHADSVFWVQEEPENMGAWPYAGGRLQALLPDRVKLGHASRVESGSPATGSALVHAQELEDLLDEAYTGV